MDSSDHLCPAMERLWIEEVRHLHALWHIGPPRKPNPAPLAATNNLAFKREDRRKKRKEKKLRRRQERQLEQQQQLQDADQGNVATAANIEWPCQPIPDDSQNTVREWGTSATPSQSKPLSEMEMARLSALQVQTNSLVACRDFFSQNCSFDDGAEEEEDLMDEGDDSLEGEQSKIRKFLLELFEKDGNLRFYYEKNWEKGEFCCLVCGGAGEKIGKKFRDCVSLVQHSNTILKTKRKEAHREFARVVCRVLGWNIERLPCIVLDVGDQLGQSLSIAAIPQGEIEKGGALDHEGGILREALEIAGTGKGDEIEFMEIKEDHQMDSSLNQKEEPPKEAPGSTVTDNVDGMDPLEIKDDLQNDGIVNQKEDPVETPWSTDR